MLTTILTNLKALQNGYANSSKELEKQLKSLQSELASEKQKRESLEVAMKQLNEAVSSLNAYLKAQDGGQQ
ncbi:hypothetical protein P3690_26195 [Vibrio parahaemolyticus]|uniref:hypothetical protein n=1 Tax=Vibrio sp. 1833 TaxID=3074578 RepID=UPI002964256E|nr:hypothetical protein [Vibrio sp. 1833]MDF5507294.1 hypothetical protein [Vibrio parahaemolyticus]MDW2144726.1 hypothetical protein [Vibrio sp. 1833]